MPKHKIKHNHQSKETDTEREGGIKREKEIGDIAIKQKAWKKIT